MDLSSLVTSALGGINALGKKQLADPPEESVFDYTPKALSDRFTAGFGKAVMIPDDVKTKTYYIAGYNSDNPAEGVLDDMFARAVYLDDNTGRGAEGCWQATDFAQLCHHVKRICARPERRKAWPHEAPRKTEQ